jgi:hypothetical protein
LDTIDQCALPKLIQLINQIDKTIPDNDPTPVKIDSSSLGICSKMLESNHGTEVRNDRI